MRVVLPLGFELFLTTHSSPGSSFLPGIILSFNRSHQRWFLWRFYLVHMLYWLDVVENSYRTSKRHSQTKISPDAPKNSGSTLAQAGKFLLLQCFFWQSRMAKAKPTWFCVNRGSCWLAAHGWEFWRPGLCGKALFQWQCWHGIEYLICAGAKLLPFINLIGMRALWFIAGWALLNANIAFSLLKDRSETLSFPPPCLFFWYVPWPRTRLPR